MLSFMKSFITITLFIFLSLFIGCSEDTGGSGDTNSVKDISTDTSTSQDTNTLEDIVLKDSDEPKDSSGADDILSDVLIDTGIDSGFDTNILDSGIEDAIEDIVIIDTNTADTNITSDTDILDTNTTDTKIDEDSGTDIEITDTIIADTVITDTGTPDSGLDTGVDTGVDSGIDVGPAPEIDVNIDLNNQKGKLKNLYGVNKPPYTSDGRGSNTYYDISTLYQFAHISYIRTHDSFTDLCTIYRDAKLYNMNTDPPTEIIGTCTVSGGSERPHLLWEVNDPKDIDNPDNYDFTSLDQVLRQAKDINASIYLTIAQAFNGPNDTTDVLSWAKISANIYKHVIGLFKPSGISVNPISVEIYNEPDGMFWAGKPQAFYIYYNEAVDLIRSIATSNGLTVNIGGSGFTTEILSNILKPQNVASNFISQVTPSRLDFYSAHHYNKCDAASLDGLVGWFDQLRTQLVNKGLTSETPLHITEWNIGLGEQCGDAIFSDIRNQSFTSGALSLMQIVDEWKVEQATFYSGPPPYALFLVSDKNVGKVTVNPSAWAIRAHSYLGEAQMIDSNVCYQSVCKSGKDMATSPVLPLSVKTGDNSFASIITNDTDISQRILLKVSGVGNSKVNLTIRTPPSSKIDIPATLQSGVYIVTQATINSLISQEKIIPMNNIIPENGSISVILTVPAYQFILVEGVTEP